MRMLDDLIKVDEDGEIYYAGWIEWDHLRIPNGPEWFRDMMRNLMALCGHCLECTALDGCYLLDVNRPTLPLHENCDCKKIDISFSKVKVYATSECDIRKFTEYVFRDEKSSKGKNKIFHNLGFNIDDAEYLQREYCRQALEQYLCGNYRLKNLDKMGQRLSIPMKFKEVEFYSGWMLYPEGKIKNTTPFGGWIK